MFNGCIKSRITNPSDWTLKNIQPKWIRVVGGVSYKCRKHSLQEKSFRQKKPRQMGGVEVRAWRSENVERNRPSREGGPVGVTAGWCGCPPAGRSDAW
jgi:hypothetical protein